MSSGNGSWVTRGNTCGAEKEIAFGSFIWSARDKFSLTEKAESIGKSFLSPPHKINTSKLTKWQSTSYRNLPCSFLARSPSLASHTCPHTSEHMHSCSFLLSRTNYFKWKKKKQLSFGAPISPGVWWAEITCLMEWNSCANWRNETHFFLSFFLSLCHHKFDFNLDHTHTDNGVR